MRAVHQTRGMPYSLSVRLVRMWMRELSHLKHAVFMHAWPLVREGKRGASRKATSFSSRVRKMSGVATCWRGPQVKRRSLPALHRKCVWHMQSVLLGGSA